MEVFKAVLLTMSLYITYLCIWHDVSEFIEPTTNQISKVVLLLINLIACILWGLFYYL
jgi:hypothetical protein